MAVREFHVVPATDEHAVALAPSMRREDAAEVMASGGYEPLDAIREALRISTYARAAMRGDEVAFVYGVTPVWLGGRELDRVGSAWLLGSDLVKRYPVAFMKTCRRARTELLERYPVLVSAIDARYRAAIGWARWLGFEAEAPIPFGKEGKDFVPVTLTKETIHV